MGPWVRGHTKRGEAEAESSDDGDNEDEEMTRDHAGFSHAILPPPAAGDGLSKGQAVVIFYHAPEQSGTGWFPGTLTKAGAVGGAVDVRFSDGVFAQELRRSTYGRFGLWVLPDMERAAEDWTEADAAHRLLGQSCRCRGQGGALLDGTLRMWCATSRRFSANLGDHQSEVELSEAEAAEAVAAAAAAMLPALVTVTAPLAAAMVEGEAVEPMHEEGTEEDAVAAAAAAAEAADDDAAGAVPWPLRWELQRSGCVPAAATLEAIVRAWPEQSPSQRAAMVRETWPDRPLAPQPGGSSGPPRPPTRPAEAKPTPAVPCWATLPPCPPAAPLMPPAAPLCTCPAEAKPVHAPLQRPHEQGTRPPLRHSSLTVSSDVTLTLCAIQVLPRRVPGTVIKYRVRVSAGGELQLLEPRRDTRTLAHAMLGEESWLFVQFDDVEQAADDRGQRARALTWRAQQSAVAEGIEVCGKRFVYFGHKEGKSMAETRGYFVAQRGTVRRTPRAASSRVAHMRCTQCALTRTLRARVSVR